MGRVKSRKITFENSKIVKFAEMLEAMLFASNFVASREEGNQTKQEVHKMSLMSDKSSK